MPKMKTHKGAKKRLMLSVWGMVMRDESLKRDIVTE